MNKELLNLNADYFQLTTEKLDSIKKPFYPLADEFIAHIPEIDKILAEKNINEEVVGRAKRIRLDIAKIRTSTKKLKDSEKEGVLKIGKAIQGCHNVIADTISEKEKKLKEIEDHFIEIEKKRMEKLQEERRKKLEPYEVEHLDMLDLWKMDQVIFDNLLTWCEATYNKKKADEKVAEKKIKEKEKAEKLRQKELIEENKKLKEEADKKAEEDRKQTLKDEEERKKREEELKRLNNKNDIIKRIWRCETQKQIDELKKIFPLHWMRFLDFSNEFTAQTRLIKIAEENKKKQDEIARKNQKLKEQQDKIDEDNRIKEEQEQSKKKVVEENEAIKKRKEYQDFLDENKWKYDKIFKDEKNWKILLQKIVVVAEFNYKK